MPTRRVSRADENSCSTTTARAFTGNKPSAGWPRRRLTQPHRRHAPAMARVRRIVPDQIEIEGLVVQQSQPQSEQPPHPLTTCVGNCVVLAIGPAEPGPPHQEKPLGLYLTNHKLLVGNNRFAKKISTKRNCLTGEPLLHPSYGAGRFPAYLVARIRTRSMASPAPLQPQRRPTRAHPSRGSQR
jgi:hypothetical protein